MTQPSGAQLKSKQSAWKAARKPRTLARRRADFKAQMRTMALSDLADVARRLNDLHERLNRKDARHWKQREIADAVNIPPRTYQTWIAGTNENTDGQGYEALARFYRRKLDDPTITRNWIVFGEQKTPAKAAGSASSLNGTVPKELQEQLDSIQAKLDRLLRAAGVDVEGDDATMRFRDPEQEAQDEDESGTGTEGP